MSSESPAEVDQAPGVDRGFPVLLQQGATTAGNSSDTSVPVGEQGSVALSIVIVIGICLLVVNVCACAGVFYQRDRSRFKEMLAQRQYKLRPASSTEPEPKTTTKADKTNKPSSSRAVTDEEFELEEMPSTLLHQPSTSTIDPHTKVSQWIAQEISDASSTPPRSHHLRPSRPDVTKFGGSDRYEASLAPLFPPLSKTAGASDICNLGLSESGGCEQGQIRPALKSSTSRSSRRKARARSQTNSTLKRDVAVGGDDEDFPPEAGPFVRFVDDEAAGRENAAMDTIRRLNLPKVLPDLPHQDAGIPAEQTAPLMTGAEDCSALGSPAPGNASLIVKGNFPHTLVLAPHPRTGLSTATKAPPPSSAEPEPCLIVRPGRRAQQATGERARSDASSRNSRSWYAQYSQSFISQSIDQDSDEQRDA